MKFIITVGIIVVSILFAIYGFQFQDDKYVVQDKVLDKYTGQYNIQYREVGDVRVLYFIFGVIIAVVLSIYLIIWKIMECDERC